MVAEGCLVDQVLGHHCGLIVGSSDLLHHHTALAVELVRVDPRSRDEVRQEVRGLEPAFGPRGDVERDEIVTGVRVQDRADALCRAVHITVRGELLAALEHEMLQKMGHPILLGALGSRTRIERDQDRHRAGGRDRDAVQGNAGRQSDRYPARDSWPPPPPGTSPAGVPELARGHRARQHSPAGTPGQPTPPR